MARLLPALILAAALLVGCARGEGSATSQPVETTEVAMARSYIFEPSSIRVTPGAVVTWTNQDNFTHDVHILGSAEWRSQPLRPGENVSHTFPAAGEYPYECAFHPQDMKGTIIVAAR
jgi:plastocyanin